MNAPGMKRPRATVHMVRAFRMRLRSGAGLRLPHLLAVLALGVLASNAAHAQGTITTIPLDDGAGGTGAQMEDAPIIESPFGLGDGPTRGEIGLGRIEEPAPIIPARTAPGGALLRALDRISGEVVDFELLPGQSKQLGHLIVGLGECRYPIEDPTGDAAGWITARMAEDEKPAFRGWMLASSPALSALDNPRYDVWILRCKTEPASGNG